MEKEIVGAVHAGKEDNPKEDLNTDGDDHALDALRYGLMGLYKGRAPDSKPEDSQLTVKALKGKRKKGWGNESFVIATPDNVISFDEVLARTTQ